MATSPDLQWNPNVLESAPWYEPLRSTGSELACGLTTWPDHKAMNSSTPPHITSGTGARIRWVEQPPRRGVQQTAAAYEERIYETGEVETRLSDWHDLFNMLCWRRFPKSKAALNSIHVVEIRKRRQHHSKRRSRVEDRLTHIDESGMVVLSSSPMLTALLRNHEWHALFWERREDVRLHMRFVIFGHGLYAKAMQPFPGMCGKGVLLDVAPELLQTPLETQLQALDDTLAHHIAHGISERLQPVPVLGIPGWWPDNEKQSFYNNTHVFRPKRGATSHGLPTS